jgi:catechol 2,3-dioxygenase-like lactoylglutathione lyase family enzyme
MNSDIKINSLDHVAIRVKDLNRSVQWYQEVLNLQKYQFEEWGAYPIMMFAGKSGIAIFPANLEDEQIPFSSKNVKIDHIAFNVDRENFQKALKKYEHLGIEYKIQDHHFFDSVYVADPDGHTIELTTLKVKDEEFYKSE